MLHQWLLVLFISGSACADVVLKRDSPRAVCTFDNSTAGAAVGVDTTCLYGCNEECGTPTGGLRFTHFDGAAYSNKTSVLCNYAEVCTEGINRVASLPYGVKSNISSPVGYNFAPQGYDFGCQIKLEGDAKTRVATLDGIFPQLKNAGAKIRKVLPSIASLPVRCNSTTTVTKLCSGPGTETCKFVPVAVTQVAGVPLPAGVKIKPVDGVGLPAQLLGHCDLTQGPSICAGALEMRITKVPSGLAGKGLCAEAVSLLIDNFEWYEL